MVRGTKATIPAEAVTSVDAPIPCYPSSDGIDTGWCNLPFHSLALLLYSWCSYHLIPCLWGRCDPLAHTPERRRVGHDF